MAHGSGRLRTPLLRGRSMVLVFLLAAVVAAPGVAAGEGLAGSRARPGTLHDDPRPERDGGTVLVKFADGIDRSARRAILAEAGGRANGRAGATGYVVAELRAGLPEDAVRTLELDPGVLDAELNFIRRASAIPNDPGLTGGGQEYLKQVRLPTAWDATRGTTTKSIAILDTGIDLDHPDLAGRIRPGFNAITGGTDVTDDHGHGTLVAGVAAASTNNGRGIAGAAWNAGIQPVKVLGSTGEGTDADVAEGITWAADRGATVINLSLGGPGYSAVLRDAVAYAVARDKVLVAATGNAGTGVPFYPAAFGQALAVGATDGVSTMAYFSNHGWHVDVAAPGISIFTTGRGSSEAYAIVAGTSFAAPIVAGIAFLVRVKNPSWTQAQTARRVRNTARDMGPRGIDPFYGQGRVDAAAALGVGAAVGPASQPAGDALEPNPTPDRARALVTSASGSISPEGDVDWFFHDAPGAGSLTFAVSPPGADPSGARAREMDPVLEVYGAALQPVGSADEGSVGDPETVSVLTAGPGRFFVAVRNAVGARSPANYTVSVSGPIAVAPPTLSTPPELWIRDVSPPDFTLTYASGGTARVEFSREMDPASIGAATVLLLNGRTGLGVAATRSYDSGTRTVTIDPSAALAGDTAYIVWVAGVRDSGGTTMSAPFTSRFKTAPS